MSFYRVRTVHTGLVGAPYLTTHYFKNDTDNEAQNCADLVQQFWADLAPRIRNTNSAKVDNVVQVVQETTGNIIEESVVITVAIPGTASAVAEWSAKQGLLALKTSTFVDGKRLQGRLFIPGVVAGDGEQAPAAPYLNTLQLGGNSLIEDSGLNGTPWAVVRRHKNDPFVPGSIAAVESVTPRPYWAVLRSRRQ